MNRLVEQLRVNCNEFDNEIGCIFAKIDDLTNRMNEIELNVEDNNEGRIENTDKINTLESRMGPILGTLTPGAGAGGGKRRRKRKTKKQRKKRKRRKRTKKRKRRKTRKR